MSTYRTERPARGVTVESQRDREIVVRGVDAKAMRPACARRLAVALLRAAERAEAGR